MRSKPYVSANFDNYLPRGGDFDNSFEKMSKSLPYARLPFPLSCVGQIIASTTERHRHLVILFDGSLTLREKERFISMQRVYVNKCEERVEKEYLSLQFLIIEILGNYLGNKEYS